MWHQKLNDANGNETQTKLRFSVTTIFIIYWKCGEYTVPNDIHYYHSAKKLLQIQKKGKKRFGKKKTHDETK